MVTAIAPAVHVSTGVDRPKSTKRPSAPTFSPSEKRIRKRSGADDQMQSKMKRSLKDQDGSEIESCDTSSSSPVRPMPKSSLKNGGIPIGGFASPSDNYRKGMYISFVNSALEERLKGNESPYHDLVSQFKRPESAAVGAGPSASQLSSWLSALTHVVSSLDRRHHAVLIDSILTLPWTTMGGDPFARVWTRFVCALCSARNEWLSPVLSRAIKGLTYRSDWRSLAYAKAVVSPSTPAKETQTAATRRQIYARIHLLIRSLLSLIPSLPSLLQRLLLNGFPRKRRPLKDHIVYIRNALEICNYADELRQGVLKMIIRRAIEIDVEIQMDYEELEEMQTEQEDIDEDQAEDIPTSGAFELDLFDGALESDSDDSSDSEAEDEIGLDDISTDEEGDEEDKKKDQEAVPLKQRLSETQKLSLKLDAIMSILFEHLEGLERRWTGPSKNNGLVGGSEDGSTSTDIKFERSTCSSSLFGAPQPGLSASRASELRQDSFFFLLSTFQRMMLPTFKSRNVQFILFWVSSLDQDFSDGFLGTLLQFVLHSRGEEDENDGVQLSGSTNEVSPILRVAAASYVASLVSRAKFVPGEQVWQVMDNLCVFLEVYEKRFSRNQLDISSSHEESGEAADSPHAVFFAVAQAVFYIFCFRWRDLRTSTSSTDPIASTSFSSSSETDPEGEDDARQYRWADFLSVVPHIIASRLNPLAACTSAVVNQFASIAQHTGFCYCFSIIEANQRSSKHPQQGRKDSSNERSQQSRQYNQAKAQQTVERLDTFFPFDPYRLPSSSKWIEPLYRTWGEAAPGDLKDDDEDLDEDEDEDEELSDQDDQEPVKAGLQIPGAGTNKTRGRGRGYGSSYGNSFSTSDASALSQSIDAMSISPYQR